MKAVWFGLAGLVAATVAAVSWFAYERTQTSDPLQITDKAAAPASKPAAKPEAAKPEAAKPEATKPVQKLASEPAPAPIEKPEEKPETSRAPDKTPKAEPDQKSADADKTPAAPESEAIAPTFDVVRVEPDGSTVIAGRAAPGWKVRVEAQGKMIGEAVANARGEWVIIADTPIPSGSSSLKLMALSPDGLKETVSPQQVAIARPKDIKVASAAPAKREQQPDVTDTADSVKASPPETETGSKPEDAGPASDAAGEKTADAASSTDTPQTGDSSAKLPPPPLGSKPDMPDDLKKAAAANASGEKQPGETAKQDDAGNMATASSGKPDVPEADRKTAESNQSADEPKDEQDLAGKDSSQEGTSSDAPKALTEKPESRKPAATSEQPKEPLVVISEKGKPSRVLQAPKPEKPAPRLTFQSVDYDDTGKVILSGKSDAGRKLRVYLNNSYIGETSADDSGNWVLNTQEKIKPGRYTLRVDQLGEGKTVLARVEAPFERAEPAAVKVARENGEVIIQPGDNLWNLSRAFYGEGIQYTIIYEANKNKIRNPNLIYPGQVFVTPKADPESMIEERENLRKRMLRHQKG